MLIKSHKLWLSPDKQAPFKQSPNCGDPRANKDRTNGTVNTINPLYVVMHYTANDSAAAAVNWLTKRGGSSAHFVIGRNGQVTQLVKTNTIAWHAGRSSWEGRNGLNWYSIAIELVNVGYLTIRDNDYCSHYGKIVDRSEVGFGKYPNKENVSEVGWQTYPLVQIEAALELCFALKAKYPSLKDCIAHSDCSPGRKFDPGPMFPLEDCKDIIQGLKSIESPSPPIAPTTAGLLTDLPANHQGPFMNWLADNSRISFSSDDYTTWKALFNVA